MTNHWIQLANQKQFKWWLNPKEMNGLNKKAKFEQEIHVFLVLFQFWSDLKSSYGWMYLPAQQAALQQVVRHLEQPAGHLHSAPHSSPTNTWRNQAWCKTWWKMSRYCLPVQQAALQQVVRHLGQPAGHLHSAPHSSPTDTWESQIWLRAQLQVSELCLPVQQAALQQVVRHLEQPAGHLQSAPHWSPTWSTPESSLAPDSVKTLSS